MNRVLLIALVLLGSACPGFGSEGADDIPETPTFTKDIKPIFDKLCNDCHGEVRAQGGESFSWRYDVCEDTEVDGVFRPGARSAAARTEDRFFAGRGGMPLASYKNQPTPNDLATVERWAKQGSKCDSTNNNGTTNNGATTSGNNGTSSTNNKTSSTNNSTGTTNNGTTTPDVPSFSDIAEILRGSCTDADGVCHQNDAGGLQITKNDPNATLASELQGNNMQGMPLIVPNSPSTSRIYIRMTDVAAPMPPAQLLSPIVTDQIEAWINAGAIY